MWTPDATGRENHGQVLAGVTPVDSPWGAAFGKAGSFDGTGRGNFPGASGIDCGAVPLPTTSSTTPGSGPDSEAGTAVGNPLVVASPWAGFGSAFSFDGVDRNDLTDGVQSDPISTAGITAFTLEAKIRRDRQGVVEIPVCWYNHGASTTQVCFIYFDPATNKIGAYFLDHTGASLGTFLSAAAVPNGVHDVAFEWNGATARLYLDGAVVASAAVASIGNVRACQVAAGRLGGWSSGDTTSPYAYQGVVDEVRLSKVARYNGAYVPSAAPFASDANTLLLWHLNSLDRNGWTVEAFVQVTRPATGTGDVICGWQDRIASSAQPPNLASLLLHVGGGTLVANFSTPAGVANAAPPTGWPAIANGLHHVVWDFDGITSRILIDGAEVRSWANGAGAVPAPGNGTARFMIGRDNDDGVFGSSTDSWPGAVYQASIHQPYPYPGIIGPVRISSKIRYPGAAYAVPAARFIPDADTLGLWNLDTWVTAKTPDASGNGRDGVLIGEPVLVPTKWPGHGRAMRFDGRNRRQASQAVNCGALWQAGSFCLEAKVFIPWQIPVITSVIAGIWNSPSVFNMLLAYNGSSGKIYGVTRHADSTYAIVYALAAPKANTRYELAMDYDAPTKTLRFFIDGRIQGAVVGSAVLAAAPGAVWTPPPALVIGGSYDSLLGTPVSDTVANSSNEPYPWRGDIDEVRLSSIVRHAASYAPSLVPFAADADTVGLWHFDRIDRTIVSPVKISDFARRADNGAVLAGAVARMFRDADDGYVGQTTTAGDGSYTLCADPLEVAAGMTYHVEFESADGNLYGKSKRGLVPA